METDTGPPPDESSTSLTSGTVCHYPQCVYHPATQEDAPLTCICRCGDGESTGLCIFVSKEEKGRQILMGATDVGGMCQDIADFVVDFQISDVIHTYGNQL